MQTEITKRGPTLNENKLAGFEKKTGFVFPESYRNFLLSYNGGKPVPDYFKVPGWRFAESFVTEFKGLADGKRVDLEELNNLLEGRLPEGYLAIGSDPGGNHLLISLKEPNRGNIYFFDHENEPDDATDRLEDYPNIYLIANDFDEFLNNLTTENEE